MVVAEPVVKNANYKKRRGHNTAEPINYISKLLHVLAPQAASTVRASVQFAAALCEISGSFLIFTPTRRASGTARDGSAFSVWLPWPQAPRPSSPCSWGHGNPPNRTLHIKAERFAGHHEAREALLLSVAGVTAVMLIESLVLLISY